MGQRGKGVPPVLHLCKIKKIKGFITHKKTFHLLKWHKKIGVAKLDKERHVYSDSK
jgi:hypothetical protein